jgi:hypothetical protein
MVQKEYLNKQYNSFSRMPTYYVVLEDMNYDNNRILFISQTEEHVMNWCLNNTNPKKQQIRLIKYDMSEDAITSETEIKVPYP